MNEKIYTALITPFDKEGNIDFEALSRLIEKLIKEGEKGFVICGTTAEAPTLSLEEKEAILDKVIIEAKGCSIIMGISSNDTKEALRQLYFFKDKAIDAFMVVVPYYNKPSKNGLYKHFATLLEATDKPLVIYNIPGRTGIEIDVDTIIQLKQKYPHLIGLKHASHNFKMVDTLKQKIPDFKIYSGEDALLKKGLDHQMDGIISVTSHVVFPKIKRFIDLYENGGNIELEDDFLRIFAYYTFIEASPAPIKYILYKQGYIQNYLRLPMTPLSLEKKKEIDLFLKHLFPII